MFLMLKRLKFCLKCFFKPAGTLGTDRVFGVSGVSSEESAGGIAGELTGGADGPLPAAV